MIKKILLLAITISCFSSCIKDEGHDQEFESGFIAGGETTIYSTGPDAYTFPLANLGSEGIAEHFLADGAFGQLFVSAPSTQFGGVGPLFNQNSCETCHVRNGRGIVPQYDNDPKTGLLLRISVPGSGPIGQITPVPFFGGQFQNKAIFGTQPEGVLSKTDIQEIVQYIDGESITLTRSIYSIENAYKPLPANILISPRLASPVFGLGLLEAIPSSDLLALTDENDADNDGISGRVNMVWDILLGQLSIGRFGWKAEQPTAGQQAADAAHNDMGLTNFYFPEEACLGQENCEEGLQSVLDMDDETTNLMAYYFQTLAVPSRRNIENAAVKKGQKLFNDINCSGCHVSKFTTGSHVIPELANQIIYPYTDMLLHDMGSGLSDNRPTYLAEGNEWRTPPLWGIGLTQVVNPKATFLHDGRAKTIEEAILWHGGEAEVSKEKFKMLDKTERSAVLAFVSSL